MPPRSAGEAGVGEREGVAVRPRGDDLQLARAGVVMDDAEAGRGELAGQVAEPVVDGEGGGLLAPLEVTLVAVQAGDLEAAGEAPVRPMPTSTSRWTRSGGPAGRA